MSQLRPARWLRPGLTLIELLVVISIIMLLSGLGLYFYPTYNERQKVVSGVDQVSGALLIAKQRAKRDGVPTGVRLVVVSEIATELQYIQQPDDFAQGRLTGVTGTDQLNFTGVDFTVQYGEGAEATLVGPGDFIELYGGGSVYQIQSVVNATTLKIVIMPSSAPLPSAIPAGETSLPNYRIIRKPRLLTGEQPVRLPETVGIDTRTINGVKLSNVQPRQARRYDGSEIAGTFYHEILFAPAGNVVSQATAAGQIYLWVRDLNADISSNLELGHPVIVTVQIRSGAIGAYPVAPGSDPFVHTRDGRDSGL